MSKKHSSSKKDRHAADRHRLSSIESALKRRPYNRRLLTGQNRIIVNPPSTLSDVLLSTTAGGLNHNGGGGCALSPPTGSPVLMAGDGGGTKYGGAATLSSSSSSIDTQQQHQQQGGDSAITTTPGRIGIRPVPTTHQIQQIKQLIERNKVTHSNELQPEVSFQPRGSTADRGNQYPKFHFNSLPAPSPTSSVVALQPAAEGEDELLGINEQLTDIAVENNTVISTALPSPSASPNVGDVDLSFNVFAALLVAFEKVPAPEHHPFDGYF